MGFYFNYRQFEHLPKVIISDALNLWDLIKRWKGKKLNDRDLDRDEIIRLINYGDISAYRYYDNVVTENGITETIYVRLPNIIDEDHIGIGEENKNIFFSENKISEFEKLNGLLIDGDNIVRNDITASTRCKLVDKIALWRKAMREVLTEKEKEVAQVAIGKLQGKTHIDICKDVFGDNIADPFGKIRKMKFKAQALAKKYGLPMPAWDIRNE